MALQVANSLFLGDYLTSEGQDAKTDIEMIRDNGFVILGAEDAFDERRATATTRPSATAARAPRSPRTHERRDRVDPTRDDLLAYDREHLWHPYTSMTAPTPVRLVTGAEGYGSSSATAREVVDGMSSWWAAIHGYRHPVLDAALAAQAGEFAHVMFGGLTHAAGDPAGRAARRDHPRRARARLPRRLRLGQRSRSR